MRLKGFTSQKRLNYRRIDVADDLRIVSSRGSRAIPSFWLDAVRAKVEGKVKIVKIFYEFSGGKSAFEENLHYLGQTS